MEELEKVIANRKIDFNKLLKYGFKENREYYEYETYIYNNEFKLIVRFNQTGELKTKIIEVALDDEFLLLNVSNAQGKYIGEVRKEYIDVILDIYSKCSKIEVFKSKQAQEIIDYVYEKYSEEPEFLWDELAGTAVFRHEKTKKWYGVILTVSKRKLGLDSDEIVEIIDLKIEPELSEKLVDNKLFFKGYHMNKKHWMTIILDESVSFEEIVKYLDNSYNIT